MKITIKNNPRGKTNSELLVKITEYYLNQLLGEGHEFGKLVISFRKMAMGVGGHAKTRRKNGVKLFLIDICKYESKARVHKILAHECTHIKQYFLKELTTSYEINMTARGLIRKKVRNWKGKEIRRSVYRNRPWEVEARRQEKMACNILKKIDAPVKVITKPVEIATVKVAEVGIGATVSNILKGGAILNGDLVKRILNGDTDKQKTLKILRAVFNLKTEGFIREVIKDSLVWVELV